jgi:hypothetical protein
MMFETGIWADVMGKAVLRLERELSFHTRMGEMVAVPSRLL